MVDVQKIFQPSNFFTHNVKCMKMSSLEKFPFSKFFHLLKIMHFSFFSGVAVTFFFSI